MKRFNLLDFTPRKLLLTAVVVGCVLTILGLIFPVYYRDSVNYMASVNALWLQNWRTAFNITYVPLLFNFAALFKIFGLDANQCLTLASSIFTIGLIFPAYGVLTHYFDRKFAAWGSVLFFIAPQITSAGFAPLTDSARWFFTLSCLWIVLNYIKYQKKYLLFLLGLFYALFSMVRSEGIVLVGLISLWFFVEQIHQDGWHDGWRNCYKYVMPVALPLIVMSVFLIPRFWQIYQETGYVALDTRQTWAIKAFLERIFPGMKGGAVVDTVTYGADTSYHSFWTDTKWHSRYWDNLFSSNFAAYSFFTILGIIFIIRERKWQYCHTLFFAFIIGNALIYMLMRSCAGRYFVINVFFLMPFTIYGLEYMWRFVRKISPPAIMQKLNILLPYALAVLLLAISFYALKHNFSDKHAHYAEIGDFMQQRNAGAKFRSDTPHPVYLIWGKNYGWGFFCDGNELVYSKQYYVNSKFTVQHILQYGLPTKYCSFAVDPLKDVKILRPDYLLDSRSGEALLSKECLEMLELVPQSISQKVRIYKVRKPEGEI